jgi:hypothetical protein
MIDEQKKRPSPILVAFSCFTLLLLISAVMYEITGHDLWGLGLRISAYLCGGLAVATAISYFT